MKVSGVSFKSKVFYFKIKSLFHKKLASQHLSVGRLRLTLTPSVPVIPHSTASNSTTQTKNNLTLLQYGRYYASKKQHRYFLTVKSNDLQF